MTSTDQDDLAGKGRVLLDEDNGFIEVVHCPKPLVPNRENLQGCSKRPADQGAHAGEGQGLLEQG